MLPPTRIAWAWAANSGNAGESCQPVSAQRLHSKTAHAATQRRAVLQTLAPELSPLTLPALATIPSPQMQQYRCPKVEPKMSLFLLSGTCS